MTKREEVFNVLFDDDDIIGVCKTKYSTGDKMERVKKSECANVRGQFFVLNSLKPESQTRKKSDVALYRNVLIEFDGEVPLDQQIDYVKSIGMPYSSIVFSGNKSHHFILSLETPFVDPEEYEFYTNYIHNIVEKADPQTKEPNKLSRLPGGIRVCKNVEQKVIEVRTRIKNEDLFLWLEKHPELKPQQVEKKQLDGDYGDRSSIIEVLDWYVQNYLKQSYDLDKKWTFVRCPICAQENRDNHRDNMCVTHENMFFNCFADKEHNSSQFFAMLELKNEHGESDAHKAWQAHNSVNNMLDELESDS